MFVCVTAWWILYGCCHCHWSLCIAWWMAKRASVSASLAFAVVAIFPHGWLLLLIRQLETDCENTLDIKPPSYHQNPMEHAIVPYVRIFTTWIFDKFGCVHGGRGKHTHNHLHFTTNTSSIWNVMMNSYLRFPLSTCSMHCICYMCY